ncbi:ABC transporter permease [Devriesea agamarum]|uniref:ABC transporter permease n=1 Tax=Devriesea agamarum TaxID=472569 RepID=UPI000AC2AD68|nr:ABC transporter permease subunit [Devriesea agamarum]
MWLTRNFDVITSATLAHLAQALPAIALSFLISVPLAKLASRTGWLRGTVTVGTGLLYAIPSLPLFIVLPLILGTGIRDPLNIVVALTMYGLALMVPAASEAFRSVDADVLASATAQGYAPLARFMRVELPLAGPVLLAGLRVVTVSTVSLVTVGAVLGVNSLGQLFTDGIQRGILSEIMTGILATAVLALVLDRLLVIVGFIAMPWTRRRGGAR